MYFDIFNSPLGIIEIVANEEFLIFLHLTTATKKDINSNSITELCKLQLKEYFMDKRKEFTIPLEFKGTEFQKLVWTELTKIPYGETVSYKDIAIAVGNPKASRAVGGAVNKNPIFIIAPCHRVIGKNGTLVGFASGLDNKTYLLNLEKSI